VELLAAFFLPGRPSCFSPATFPFIILSPPRKFFNLRDLGCSVSRSLGSWCVLPFRRLVHRAPPKQWFRGPCAAISCFLFGPLLARPHFLCNSFGGRWRSRVLALFFASWTLVFGLRADHVPRATSLIPPPDEKRTHLALGRLSFGGPHVLRPTGKGLTTSFFFFFFPPRAGFRLKCLWWGGSPVAGIPSFVPVATPRCVSACLFYDQCQFSISCRAVPHLSQVPVLHPLRSVAFPVSQCGGNVCARRPPGAFFCSLRVSEPTPAANKTYCQCREVCSRVSPALKRRRPGRGR